jgi:hypothetical protein
VGARHLVTLLAVSLMGVVLAFWLPGFAESIYRFFQRIFQLQTWPEIVVANDLAGLYFFLYWIGVFYILAIYIAPLEERRLDLYLSKPLTRRDYMFARIFPIMTVLAGLGIIAATAQWLALAAAGLSYPVSVHIGATTPFWPGRCS